MRPFRNPVVLTAAAAFDHDLDLNSNIVGQRSVPSVGCSRKGESLEQAPMNSDRTTVHNMAQSTDYEAPSR